MLYESRAANATPAAVAKPPPLPNAPAARNQGVQCSHCGGINDNAINGACLCRFQGGRSMSMRSERGMPGAFLVQVQRAQRRGVHGRSQFVCLPFLCAPDAKCWAVMAVSSNFRWISVGCPCPGPRPCERRVRALPAAPPAPGRLAR
eukprot:364867-Chlamydomonas_euryale.AAC.8